MMMTKFQESNGRVGILQLPLRQLSELRPLMLPKHEERGIFSLMTPMCSVHVYFAQEYEVKTIFLAFAPDFVIINC